MKMLMPVHAKDNAQHIANKDYKTGYTWFDDNQPDKDVMRVLPVGLGGAGGFGGIDVVDAIDIFDGYGRARGVQQNR